MGTRAGALSSVGRSGKFFRARYNSDVNMSLHWVTDTSENIRIFSKKEVYQKVALERLQLGGGIHK